MKFIQIIILMVLCSCHSKQDTRKDADKAVVATNNETPLILEQNADTPKTEIIETFADSLHIGEKGKCKVELIKHRVYDDSYIIIKFYIKGRITMKDPETWLIQNRYSYPTNALMEFHPNISDFNNDSFNDITFISGSAARGSNEIRRLFIYDSEKQELLSIVNSEDYPNLLYNKELDCLDAFLVYGGCSTVFLNIEGDSLKKFASVELDNGMTVSTFDKKGREKIILKNKTSKGSYIRYKNFRPLKEYDNW